MFVEIYQKLHSSVYSMSLIISIDFFDIFRSGRWFSPNRKRARWGRTSGQNAVLHGYAACPVDLPQMQKSRQHLRTADG
jgi:hypothetical protein